MRNAEADQSDRAKSDQSDPIKPWTIKGIPPDVRNGTTAAAKREGMEIGDYVARALLAQIQADRNRTRQPVAVAPQPDPPSAPKSDQEPLVATPKADPPVFRLDIMERVLEQARLTAATPGIPDSTRKITEQLVNAQLRALKPKRSPTLPAESVTGGPTEAVVRLTAAC